MRLWTGFKSSVVWNKLYDFQRDAALGIINKLEQYNGCILADSVGLGKTFTALAVIKYYEGRNKNVLVLCPKKLKDNWMTYRGNLVNNPLAQDRLRYDILFHTDLSRDRGDTVIGLPIDRINWGKQEFDNRIVEAIARQNKHKLVFLLIYEDQQQLALYSSKLYKTSWMPAEEIKLEARGQNIPAIWEGFVEQIALTEEKPAAAPMSIEERLRRQEQIAKLRKDMEKLEAKTRNGRWSVTTAE